MSDKRVWQSRRGPIAIELMTNGHLLAAIRWAEHNTDRIRMHRAFTLDTASQSVGGEQASYSLEAAAEYLYEAEDPNDWWEEYRWLIDEAIERGLLLPASTPDSEVSEPSK